MRRRVIALAIVLLALPVGCGLTPVATSAPSGLPEATRSSNASQPASTATAAACMSALLRGQLTRAADGSLTVKDDVGVSYSVVWPAGYTKSSDAVPKLLDAQGVVIAQLGDRVLVVGGVGEGGRWIACSGGVAIAH